MNGIIERKRNNEDIIIQFMRWIHIIWATRSSLQYRRCGEWMRERESESKCMCTWKIESGSNELTISVNSTEHRPYPCRVPLHPYPVYYSVVRIFSENGSRVIRFVHKHITKSLHTHPQNGKWSNIKRTICEESAQTQSFSKWVPIFSSR